MRSRSSPSPRKTARRAHWKLDAIEAHAGERPLAWIDDAHDDSCRAWASARAAPTLLVTTDPAAGLTAAHVEALELLGRPMPSPTTAELRSVRTALVDDHRAGRNRHGSGAA